MEHHEFVSACRAKQIEIEVDRKQALEIANAGTILPARYQQQHMRWTWAWLMTLPAGLLVMYFVKWWAGLLVLLLVTSSLFRATNKAAMQSIIDYALEDATFYDFAVSHDVITIRPKA